MDTTTRESGILLKAQELCQSIVEQPDFQTLKANIDAFLADELLRFKYQQLDDFGNVLHMKQGTGVEITPEEIAQFESLREELLGNSVVTRFMDAQEQLQSLRQLVGRCLDKTFELGRRPGFEDLQDGSCCGGGCH